MQKEKDFFLCLFLLSCIRERRTYGVLYGRGAVHEGGINCLMKQRTDHKRKGGNEYVTCSMGCDQ